MLGQIVINHQCVTAVVSEVFSHGSTSVRRQIKQGSRVGRTGRNDNRLIHHAFFFQSVDQSSDLRQLLTNSHINVHHASLLTRLVDHRINSNCRLTSLTVADNKLTLTTTDREHSIDRHNTGHQRFVNRLTTHHANSRTLN